MEAVLAATGGKAMEGSVDETAYMQAVCESQGGSFKTPLGKTFSQVKRFL